MPDRRDYLSTQRWLNAAVGLGYAVAFLAGAGTGFQSHRVSRPVGTLERPSTPAEPGRTARLASIR